MELKVTWAEIRDRRDLKNLALQCLEKANRYIIWLEDGKILLHTEIDIEDPASADQGEFEASYKPFCNSIEQVHIWDEHNPEVQGFFHCPEFEADIPSGTGWKEIDYTFTYPLSMYNGAFKVLSENVGDKVEVHAMPKKIVGAITANTAVDDTEISVDATSLGFFMSHKYFTGHLIEGANVSELGIITGVDLVAGTITVEDGCDFAHTATTPTYVAFTANPIPMMYLNMEGYFQKGQYLQGGALLPAGEKLRIRYYNADGVAKKLYWSMEYRF